MENQNRDLPRLDPAVSDFKQVGPKTLYVDKTLIIRDIIDSGQTGGAFLFTRPRRFGKTFLLSTLKAFFEKPGTVKDIEATEDTALLFRDKKIWACPEEYRAYQGQYPVVYLSFKEVKADTWEGMYAILRLRLVDEVSRHPEILNSGKCLIADIDFMKKLSEGKLAGVLAQLTLQVLTRMLAMHWDAPVVLIIDDYDTPLQESHSCGFYEDARYFLGSLLHAGLKDNSHLQYCFLAGILRAANVGVFAGLSNLLAYTVLDKKFSTYFGFTEGEVKEIACLYGMEDKCLERSDWYGGYRFGGSRMYNPWSVLNYFSGDGQTRAYWADTTDNREIAQMIAEASPDTLWELLQIQTWEPGREAVRKTMDFSVIRPDPGRYIDGLFSYLLQAGYLTAELVEEGLYGRYICDLFIPNREVRELFQEKIVSRFLPLDRIQREEALHQLLSAMGEGDTAQVRDALWLLLEGANTADLTLENAHPLLLTSLFSCLHERYSICFHREAGEGRYSIQLEPRRRDETGFFLMLKTVQKEPKRMKQTLSAAARRAVNQSHAEENAAVMKERGVESVRIYGAAFYQRNVSVVMAQS